MEDVWHRQASDDYSNWEKTNPKIAVRIDELVEDALAHPFTGKGKPKPLKWDLRGCWSRRITKGHRLVYQVEGDLLYILFCRSHYG
jgi:toxin YoeB